MIVNFKKTHPDAITPTKGTEGAAAFDFYANGRYPVVHYGWILIDTGIAIEIPDGYVGLLTLRSSMGKKGFTMPHSVGIIDSDFRGSVKVMVMSNIEQEARIEKGDRIAQLTIVPILQCQLNEVQELSETQRGDGGFGSTGK